MYSYCNQMNQHSICYWQATADQLFTSGVRECVFRLGSACLWMLIQRWWLRAHAIDDNEKAAYPALITMNLAWWVKLSTHIHYTRARKQALLASFLSLYCSKNLSHVPRGLEPINVATTKVGADAEKFRIVFRTLTGWHVFHINVNSCLFYFFVWSRWVRKPCCIICKFGNSKTS